jgi:hypothetical protein
MKRVCDQEIEAIEYEIVPAQTVMVYLSLLVNNSNSGLVFSHERMVRSKLEWLI